MENDELFFWGEAETPDGIISIKGKPHEHPDWDRFDEIIDIDDPRYNPTVSVCWLEPLDE